MKKLNSEERFIIRMFALVAVMLMFVVYGKYLTKVVREETIQSAELIEITDDGYKIGFGDEVHEYDFD